jgi:GNAT superfamily N-acetyltransferase
MKIRSYRKEDADKVVEFHERVLKQTGVFAPGPWNDDMRKIEEVYIRPGGCFLLIEENEEIIAMGALKIISEKEAEIKRMRVDPARQRQGFGQLIFNRLLEFAHQREINRLILDTTEIQTSARRFYEKNNFIEYGRKTWNGHVLILYERILHRTKKL